MAPIFHGLNDTAMDELLQRASIKSYRRGETLFMQGDPADAFFVVIEGWTKIYRITQSGDEAVVGVFTRGQSFAEAAAFTNGQFPATGETVTDSRLLRVPSQQLVEILGKAPEIGLAMLASTSQHLHMLIKQIEQLKAHTGAQRVAEFLLSLTNAKAGACILELPYDKALIAGRLGIKPESLSRAFQKLRGYGVTVKQNLAHIDNLTVLQDLVDQERAVVMQQKR
ncbi:cyclic nucleotide-binding protein [Cohaesibacter celericrescens]|uniref:Cyclic nucleotide-binding protein n=2 Tax=Cohaesibacter celericrescens TaxID=2067669 RepID=A0A2N5XRF0_9HYPH|nr:cyclic nucleotide-binding protein [Cohaesibacter celericrescens]